MRFDNSKWSLLLKLVPEQRHLWISWRAAHCAARVGAGKAFRWDVLS